MYTRNFYVGMGMGLLVGCTVSMLTRSKKSCMKSNIGRTIKTIGDVADSVCESMGW